MYIYSSFFKDSIVLNPFKILLFIPLLLSAISCNYVSKKEKLASIEFLECKEINFGKELYLPLKLVYNNNKLFIPDFHDDKMVSEICLEKFTRLQHFAQRGAGPVEFLGPLLIWVYDNKLYVFDRQKFKLGFFNLDIPDKQSVYQFSSLFSLHNSFSKLVNIDSSRYVGAGYFKDGRYAVVNHEGEVLNYFGSYPSYAEAEDLIPYEAKAMFHQVKFSASYENRKVAALSSHVLDIIDFGTSETVVSNRILLSEYTYDYSSGNYIQTIPGNNTVLGAQSVTSNKDYIFILNRPFTKNNQNKENQEILIYNWDGEFVRKYMVTCQITNIVVNKDDNLYVTFENPVPKLGIINGLDL